MRVLLSSHGAGPFGAERVLLTLAAGLRDRGHDVVVEIPHDGPALDAAHRLEGVSVWHSRRPRLPRNAGEAIRYLAGTLPAAVRLWRGIRRGAFDVVWVNSLFNPIAALAARAAGTPVVWHLHERNLPGVFGMIMAGVIRVGASVPVAISNFVAGTYEAAGAGRMALLLNAQFREIEPEPLRRRDRLFTVGYVGQLEPRKRVVDVLEAVRAIPDTHALIVGDGKRRHEVEDAIRRLGLLERATIVGFADDVAAHLREMDCVVLPARAEPFGLVALEAMAAGRPVIASRHGAHPEVLGDAALYFTLGDTAELAAQIERLMADSSLAESLRMRGIERVRRFAPARWFDEVEAILARAAGEPVDVCV